MPTPTSERNDPGDEDEEAVCQACGGTGVIEISKSGHPLDPDAREAPCPECQASAWDEPDPDARWDSRMDKEVDDDSR